MMKSLNCVAFKQGLINARLHSAAAFWLDIDCTNSDVDKSVLASTKAFKLSSPKRSINPFKHGVLLNKLADFMEKDTVYSTSLETSNYRVVSKRYTASHSVDVASSVQKGNLIAFKRAHQIPQGLISNIQIRTHRNYSTDSGNRTSSNISKSTIRNDPEKSSLNDTENKIINDPEKFTTLIKDKLKVFEDMFQGILNENDLSKRSELGANLLLNIKELIYAIESSEDKTDQALIERVNTEYELKAAKNTLYFVKCCAAIEKFELDYGSSAVIDYESLPEDLSCTEEDKLLRALQLEWIFANRSEEDRVNTLLVMVNDSKEFDSLAEFCGCIAVVHEDLSRTIQALMLTPGLQDPNFRCVTTDPKASKALTIFMTAFEINDFMNAVKKLTDHATMINQKLIYI